MVWASSASEPLIALPTVISHCPDAAIVMMNRVSLSLHCIVSFRSQWLCGGCCTTSGPSSSETRMKSRCGCASTGAAASQDPRPSWWVRGRKAWDGEGKARQVVQGIGLVGRRKLLCFGEWDPISPFDFEEWAAHLLRLLPWASAE